MQSITDRIDTNSIEDPTIPELRVADQPTPPVPVTDRLASLYRRPGPFTSVVLSTQSFLDDHNQPVSVRWSELRVDLESQNAPTKALNAIEARLLLPIPDDTAAIAVLAAADGTTIVDHGLEPPRHDLAVVDALPYAAPLLEWEQRRIPHLVVAIDDHGFDIVLFAADGRDIIESHPFAPSDAVVPVADAAARITAELVIVSGPVDVAQPLTDRLTTHLPTSCRVVAVHDDHHPIDLADEVVRLVSDAAARRTVHRLREHRFLEAHDEAVDGVYPTVDALAVGQAERILVHDDPSDQRRVWVGDEPNELAVDHRSTYQQARLVDALIWSAIGQGVPIHITPRTGPTGPDDDTAAHVHRDLLIGA